MGAKTAPLPPNHKIKKNIKYNELLMHPQNKFKSMQYSAKIRRQFGLYPPC